MEETQQIYQSRNDILRALSRAVGTFLFVFFMMAQLVVFTSNLIVWNWVMPFFVVPSSLVCLTFGADYWIGKDHIRLQSYWISCIVAAIFLVPISLLITWETGTTTALGFFATLLLPLFTILYTIWKVKKSKANRPLKPENLRTIQSKQTRHIVQKSIRVLCLISVCCALLESSHRAMSNICSYLRTPPDFINFNTLLPLALSIISAILLARFLKVEFVRRDS